MWWLDVRGSVYGWKRGAAGFVQLRSSWAENYARRLAKNLPTKLIRYLKLAPRNIETKDNTGYKIGRTKTHLIKIKILERKE